ncbi:MAG TPA: NUDIX domain-containing protein [Candidatus Paceibacterota bacterium]|nr:NUDIX domain-containing protein [Candidatus Paceibacterota bacterium]
MRKGADYPGVTVSYFCHDGKGNVLMSLRSNNCRDEHGRWDVGGGSVDFDETVEGTLKKEIAEEYCTNIVEQEFLGYRDIFREQEGTKTHWISFDFKVKVDPTKVKNGEPNKFLEVRWFKIGEFPKPMHSQFQPFLTKYKDRLMA